LEDQGPNACIRIRDDGVGMSEDFIRTRLFRPFDTTKGNAGMGIGVYEAREFIHGLGGRMEVRSAPGEGSTFTILLPAAPADILESGNDGIAEVAN
jgi:signal transduction histidine kinase